MNYLHSTTGEVIDEGEYKQLPYSEGLNYTLTNRSLTRGSKGYYPGVDDFPPSTYLPVPVSGDMSTSD